MIDEYIESLLAPVALPLAYRRFVPYKNKPVPAPPFMVYFVDSESGYGADGLNLIKRRAVTVELYTDNKDPALEARIEDAIRMHEFDKTEEYLDDERLFMVSYEFTIYVKLGRENYE